MQDKQISIGITEYYGEYDVEISPKLRARIAVKLDCKPDTLGCYLHPTIGTEIVTVKGVYAGYLEDYEREELEDQTED